MGSDNAITGSCHCGNVKWSYSLPLESVTACNCRLCRRYGALWAYGELGDSITVTGATRGYGHGRKISSYHACEHCGCITHYVVNAADENGKLKTAVNMRTTDDPARIAELMIDHFDGFDTFEDLPRDHRRVKDMWF